MMNNKLAIAKPQNVGSIQEVTSGVSRALTVKENTPFVMAFQGRDGAVNPFIKKQGRILQVLEAGRTRGGVALMQPYVVKASYEKAEDLMRIYQMLPDSEKIRFMEKRGGDFRVFSCPDTMALVLYVVVFRNGEKWVNEGTCNKSEIDPKAVKNSPEQQAMARAFNKTVGYAVGLANPDQLRSVNIAEMEDDDDYDEPMPDASQLNSLMGEGAGPDGQSRFRTIDITSVGTGAAGTGAFQDGSESTSGAGSHGAEDSAGHPGGARGHAGVVCGAATGSPLDMVLRLAADRGVNAEDLAGRPVSDLSTGELRDLYRRIRSM